MADDETIGDRHTSSQKPEDEAKLPPAIIEAVAALRRAFVGQAITPLYWNKNYVAVPLEVGAELPGRGPVGGVDIRAREPIYLLFDRQRYPHKAPSAWSDRRDFPKSSLPHLNPTKPGQPANFCLHRGNLDTWFAEHSVVDLVNRVRFWLRDAARNRLVPDGDGFEPTRPHETLGTMLFDPEKYLAALQTALTEGGNTAGYRLLAYELLDKDAAAAVGAKRYTARNLAVIDIASGLADAYLKLATVINDLADDPAHKGKFQRQLFGLLIWADADVVTPQYFAELPDTLDRFISWSESLGMPTQRALQDYLAGGFHFFAGLPITLAVRRPRPLLGGDSAIELLSFVVIAGGDHWPTDGHWDLRADVWITDHRTPLSPEFARHISSHPRDRAIERMLLLGCGALGSKVALHFSRSGQTAFTLVDPLLLSPHNVVRHALGGQRVGQAKSEALKEDIVELYPGFSDESLGVSASIDDAFDYLFGERRAELETHRHLIDATASTQVFNMLVGADLSGSLSVARIEIADQGKLGLLSFEGPGRNPRLDDLQAILFDSALDDPAVSRWLMDVRTARQCQVGSGLEEVQIGLSCGSSTMRLADETVALHAAALTRQLRRNFDSPGGALYRLALRDDGALDAASRAAQPVTVLTARNDLRWEVRFANGLVEKMKQAMRNARPSETGGLLVGMVHGKRRIVYVTRLLEAPGGSEGSPMAFIRGVGNLPETITDIEERSGGLIGYVGEWHSHPAGGPDLSLTDIVAAARLKRRLDQVPLPTTVAVVTPRGVYPHVFEPGIPLMRVNQRFLVAVEAR